MKTYFFIVAIVAFPLVSLSQDGCRQFVKGNFSIEGQPFIKIKRTKGHQYENDTREKIKSAYKLKWLDSCTYQLTMTRTNHRIKDLVGVPIVHKIIRTGKNSYTYAAEYSYMSMDQCGTLRRHVSKEETIVKVE